MLPKRVLIGIAFLFVVIGVVLASALYIVEREPYYNCLYLPGGLRVQLNSHIDRGIEVVSTSPDGNHRLLKLRYPNTLQLVVENLQNGTWQFIDSKHYAQTSDIGWQIVNKVTWSTNNEFIHYHEYVSHRGEIISRFGGIVSLHSNQRAGSLPAQSVNFSPSGDYVYLWQYSPVLFSTRSFEPVAIDHLPSATTSVSQWSPTDNRLAYIAEEEHALVIFDPAQSSEYLQLPIPVDDFGVRDKKDQEYLYFEWSPDGNHLAVTRRLTQHKSHSGWSTTYIFSASGENMNPLTQFQTRVIQPKEDWGTNAHYFPRQLRGMFTNEHEYVFFQLSTNMSYQTGEPSTYRYEMWRYDLLTQQYQLVTSDIRDYSLNSHKIALVREDAAHWVLEIRDLDGRHPLPARTYTLDVSPDCRWPPRPAIEHILICSTKQSADNPPYGRDEMIFDEQGGTIWPPDDMTQQTTAFYWEPTTTTWFTASGRFIILSLRLAPNNSRGAQLVDIQTKQAYLIPSELVANRSPYIVGGWYGYFGISPWPDDVTSWAVRFPAINDFAPVVYRFYPEGNIWELAPFTSPQYWSPDGKRFAFVRDNGIPYQADLIVQGSDGSKQWHLGAFPTDMLDRKLQWTQCGGPLAQFRDDRVAETPH